MIGHLKGTIEALRSGYALLEASGVGYKIATTKDTLKHLKQGTLASLWTYLAVRENALDLYGFRTEEELRFFELLLTVPGIGPKSALAVLDIASIETLQSAIASGNAQYLTKVSGIGKKTSEKIVLELKDKVGVGNEKVKGAMKGDEEALEALQALGYSAGESRDALRKVPPAVAGSSARLREALRVLGS
ncbi:MAG TPA: Holliday junction branch migration protein RuvA [Candidatus Paceibacterota bacterium]